MPKPSPRGFFFILISNPECLCFIGSHGGSISAEHGVGLLKKDFLHYSRSPAEIGAMRAIKKLFDPDQILNPGKVLA